jgi:hypothetical protein
MKKVQLIALMILGLVFGVQAQVSDDIIVLSEVEAGNVNMKLSNDGKSEVFSITVIDEDHSCVVDFCGYVYNNKEKTYKENIEGLNRSLKAIDTTLGNVEKCAVLKWENEGIKFTVYGIAPNVAYICVDGHGHGILSKENIEKLSTWIDGLTIK